jgi:PBSX family phage terminase large subunit
MTPVTFDYTPLPVFESFHASTEKDRLVVGGYGSGKSHALCAEAIALGLEDPGVEILVMRKTVPALKKTTEKIFVSLLPPEFLAQCQTTKAGGHLETLQFPNGSLYYFAGCDDWRKHRSHNLAFIVWDEADEFTPEDYEGLQSRIRQTKRTPEARALGHTGPPNRIGNILACNPQGHNWIWKDFISDDRKDGTAAWISTSFDNPYLAPEYFDRLLSMPEPWIRRYVMASFDEFAGAIYPDWSYNTHVIPPVKDSAGKYKYDPASFFRMGFDPGTSAGNAGVWVYYDKDKHRFVAVAEYCETGVAASAHAKEWRRIEAQHGMRVQRRIGDPKAVTQRDRGSNVKLSDQYARLGFRFQLGPSNVTDRVTALGELIAQGRFVVTTECPQLYEQLLNYRWDDLTPAQVARGTEAKPLKKDVDLVDAAQYAISNYVPPPKIKPTEKPEQQHDREVHEAIRKQIRRRRKARGRARNDLGMRV